jgi:hypothetical protein
MFDLHIGINLKWLNTTGTFIRDKVEDYFDKNYVISLYETQALNFKASYLMRLVDAATTGFVVTLGSMGFYYQSPLSPVSKVFAIGAFVVLYAMSNALLYNSIKGHKFKSIDTPKTRLGDR